MQQPLDFIQCRDIRFFPNYFMDISNRNPHWHDGWEIDAVLEGSIDLIASGKEITLNAGEVVLFMPDEPHWLRQVKEGNRVLSIRIDPGFYHDFFPKLDTVCFSESLVSAVCGEEHLKKILRIMGAAAAIPPKSFEYPLQITGAVCDLLAWLLMSMPYRLLTMEEQRAKKNKMERLKRLTGAIENNYGKKLLLSELAERERLSMTYLSHFFRDHLFLSFQEYLGNVRLGYAVCLAAETNMSIKQIGSHCGFSDPRYLQKLFVREFGGTLSEFRARVEAARQKNQYPMPSYRLYTPEETATFLLSR